MRVAVVGAGPKGLYSLERLAAELHATVTDRSVEVHIFEPHPHPGAGPVYDPEQPDYLRMNFSNDKIDMWDRDAARPSPTAEPRLNFVEFQRTNGENASPAAYAPRADVGRYLRDGFGQVVDSLKQVAEVQVHREAVEAVRTADGAFVVTTNERTVACDEVLLATGHLSRTSPSPAGIAAYPVDQSGGVCDIESGSIVAVRGMGLTAIDVVLALTEGRGGRFEPNEATGGFTYEPSGRDPSAVLLYSRTGRPMAPKPHPVLMPETDATAAACGTGSAALDDLGTDGDASSTSVVRILVETATAVLEAETRESGSSIADHLDRLLAREAVTAAETFSELTAGVEIAHSRRRPDPDWALGVAWRGIYSALVRLAATRKLDDSWPHFSAVATEMERIAFGPPAENAARLLALVQAGIVDLSFAAGPTLTDGPDGILLRSGSGNRTVDVHVDAVIAPPGAAPNPSLVIAGLLRTGLARTSDHSSGLDVTPDGTCIGADGRPTRGLAAVGRPTEGTVLGNDTLSRQLHDAPARWARTVVGRVHEPMIVSVP